jgi:hypothetical protein
VITKLNIKRLYFAGKANGVVASVVDAQRGSPGAPSVSTSENLAIRTKLVLQQQEIQRRVADSRDLAQRLQVRQLIDVEMIDCSLFIVHCSLFIVHC